MEKVLNKLYDDLKRAGSYALFDYDLKFILNCRIFQYKDLPNINHVNEILPNRNDAVILFIPNGGGNIGHWCALLKYNNIIEYFDSYGIKPKNYDLLKNKSSGYNLIYNKYSYQQAKFTINTCGYHSIFRIYCCLYKNFDLKKYYDFMKTPKDHDRAVVFYVSRLVGRKLGF